jgi:hypothetical protein
LKGCRELLMLCVSSVMGNPEVAKLIEEFKARLTTDEDMGRLEKAVIDAIGNISEMM